MENILRRRYASVFSVGVFLTALSFRASGAELDTKDFLEGFSNQVAAAFKKGSRLAPTLSSSGPCQITAGAPDWGMWRSTQADIDGEYVLLHYYFEQAPAPLPTSVLFVWKRDGMYAPWVVYTTRQKILQAKVNMYGGVAFFESPPNGVANGPDDLLYCAQSNNPLDLNSQYTAYPCAMNPGTAFQVDRILWNQTFPLLGSQAPDGKFYGLDWIADRLAYTRSSISLNQSTVNLWDAALHTNLVIDSVFYSQWTQNDLYLNNVDRTGAIGYQILNFGSLFSGISIEYRGAYPTVPGMLNQYTTFTSLGSRAYFFRETTFSTGTYSLASSAFVQMSGEQQGFYRLKPVAATPTTPAVYNGDLYARSSFDNFQTDYLVAQAPNPNSALSRPTRVNFPNWGEGLMANSGANGGYGRIEYFFYIPPAGGAGTYIHIQTVDPHPALAKPNLGLLAVTDDASIGAALGIQYTSNATDGTVVLIECQ